MMCTRVVVWQLVLDPSGKKVRQARFRELCSVRCCQQKNAVAIMPATSCRQGVAPVSVSPQWMWILEGATSEKEECLAQVPKLEHLLPWLVVYRVVGSWLVMMAWQVLAVLAEWFVVVVRSSRGRSSRQFGRGNLQAS